MYQMMCYTKKTAETLTQLHIWSWTDLDAGLVDVRITSGAAATRLTEDDHLLKQKDTSKTFLTTIIDAEVGLT